MTILGIFLTWMIVVFYPAYLVTRHAASNKIPSAGVWVLICLVLPIFGFLLYLTYWQRIRFDQL